MGPYCKFCDHRCFVPDPSGGPIILATCPAGMQHDLKSAGYDIDLARIFAATTAAVDALVAAEVRPRTTAAHFAQLAARLRTDAAATIDEAGVHRSDATAAESLAQLLAAAVLRAARAVQDRDRRVGEAADRAAWDEQERERHVDEIARLKAQLDIERARHDHVVARLRRRIHYGRRTRAALRNTHHPTGDRIVSASTARPPLDADALRAALTRATAEFINNSHPDLPWSSWVRIDDTLCGGPAVDSAAGAQAWAERLGLEPVAAYLPGMVRYEGSVEGIGKMVVSTVADMAAYRAGLDAIIEGHSRTGGAR